MLICDIFKYNSRYSDEWLSKCRHLVLSAIMSPQTRIKGKGRLVVNECLQCVILYILMTLTNNDYLFLHCMTI